MQTDVSDSGIGAVLGQRDENGTERPIVYYSKKLLLHRERHKAVEKEGLATSSTSVTPDV